MATKQCPYREAISKLVDLYASRQGEQPRWCTGSECAMWETRGQDGIGSCSLAQGADPFEDPAKEPAA